MGLRRYRAHYPEIEHVVDRITLLEREVAEYYGRFQIKPLLKCATRSGSTLDVLGRAAERAADCTLTRTSPSERSSAGLHSRSTEF